jgi:hypothetical protein
MRFLRFAAAVAATALMTSSAGADTISKGDAQARVAAVEKDHDGLLAKLPGLRPIDQVVRNDCAAKVPGHTDTDKFCTCASAITMSLWRSGIDPKMIDRLKNFLNGAGALQAPDFVKFEGPELYRPLCELGT